MMVVCGSGNGGGMWGGGGDYTKKMQFRQGRSDIRAGSVVRSSDVRAVSDVRCLGESQSREEQPGFEVEMAKMVKSGGFRGWKGWGKGGKARSSQNKANPRIQTKKIATHEQITKK